MRKSIPCELCTANVVKGLMLSLSKGLRICQSCVELILEKHEKDEYVNIKDGEIEE